MAAQLGGKTLASIGLIGSVIVVVLMFLVCFLREETQTSAPEIVQRPGLNFFHLNLFVHVPQEITPYVMLRLTHFGSVHGRATFEASCSARVGESPIRLGRGMCEDVYVNQTRRLGMSFSHPPPMRLHESPQEWKVDMEGSHFRFPFERFTITVQVGGAEVYFVDASTALFERTIKARWENVRAGAPRENVYSILVVEFSRPGCTWLLSMVVGLLVMAGAYYSWRSRGSPQAFIPSASYLLTLWPGRSILAGDMQYFPTIFDIVLVSACVFCAVTYMFPPPVVPDQPRRRIGF